MIGKHALDSGLWILLSPVRWNMPKDVKPSPKRRRRSLPEPVLIPRKASRIRDPNSVLVRIIKDERISPHRALFAQMQLRYFSYGMKDGKEVPMTPQQAKDKELMYNLLITQFGNPKSIQWQDREDSSIVDPPTSENLDAGDKLRELFKDVVSKD